MAREYVIRRACPSAHSRVKSILVSLSNIVLHDRNYHDVTSFTNLTTFALYKIRKACIISVNTQIMKWHNKDSGSKICRRPPPRKLWLWVMAQVGLCANTAISRCSFYMLGGPMICLDWMERKNLYHFTA